MKGTLNKYCTMQFGEALTDFCTPGFCSQDPLGFGFGLCIQIGALVGILILITVAILFVRKYTKNIKVEDKYLQQGSSLGTMNTQLHTQNSAQNLNGYGMSPPMDQPFGSVRYTQDLTMSPMQQQHPNSMMMSPPPIQPFPVQNNNFQQQQQQYDQQQKYDQQPQQQLTSTQSSIEETEDEKFQRRRKQLIDFYEYHDPDRDDIVEHADKLMNKYDFKAVAKALKSKYGMLPPGWEDELDKKKGKKKLNSSDDNPQSYASPAMSMLSKKEPIPTMLQEQKKKANPKFKKYNAMAKVGLTEEQILQAMQRDGVDSKGFVFVPE